MLMRYLLAFLLLCSFGPLFAQKMLQSAEWCAEGRKLSMPPLAPDLRSDTIDILHTAIALNVSAPPQLSGVAQLSLQAKLNNVAGILLDLEGLIVDSVSLDGNAAGFSQSGPALHIGFPTVLNLGQTAQLQVVYHGAPVTDASGWGGVYNQNGYFYNLGVGFAADPHSFGRAWFPCFDNFVERCSFEFDILSNASKPAYCNGYLVDEQPIGPANILRKWKIDQAIPSYLACFATGPYTSFKRVYSGENGPIPVEIAAAAADTNKVKATFQHLPQAIAAFEHWYGPYRWNKIGYSLVPFNSGAMEHATNIAIMRAAIDGSLGFETLWAHELSHHWWGDLATCSTPEDMWLNEGWAVYSEHLFTEWVYGQEAFRTAVRDNFLNVLQNTHVAEGGYRAVSGLPHDLTYGAHVYQKGAVVAHNLRGYMGDSLFRAGLRAVLNETQFDDWSSADLRDKLENATGLDLHPFFDDAVFAPGFTHFALDSFTVQANGSQYNTSVFIKQKVRGAPHLYQQVPLELTFVDADWQRVYRSAVASGEQSIATFSLPFVPAFVWVNTNQKLLLARAEKERVIKSAGQNSFAPAKLEMKVNALTDSALVRVEHHFAMPDTAGANPNGYALTNRYWSVSGDFPAGFDASASVFYDGRGQLDQLDAELFAQTGPQEDSVLILYRPGPGHPWTECPDYFKNMMSATSDRFGFIRIEHVLPGEYTFAKGATALATSEAARRMFALQASPNPAQSTIRVSADHSFDKLLLFNSEGGLMQEGTYPNGTQETKLRVAGYPAGSYWLLASGVDGVGVCSVLIVQ